MTVTDQQFNALAAQVSTLQTTVGDIIVELGNDPEGVYADISTRFAVLESRLGALATTIAGLTANVGSLQSQINVINSQITVIQSEIAVIQTQIIQIFTELGTNPQGTYPDVATRLAAMQTQLNGLDLSAGVTISSGIGAPTSTPGDGSIYLREDGYIGAAVYSYQGGVWGALGSGIVNNIQGDPIATTPPVSHATLVYDTTLNQYDIRQLTLDDVGPKFSITGFSGGSTVEIGVTVTNPTFSASYSSAPSSAEITNTLGLNSPLPLVSPYTSGTVAGSFHQVNQSSISFTLTAVAATTQSAGQSISFLPRMYGGVGAPSATNAIAAGTIVGPTALLSTGDTINNLGLFSSPVGSTFGPFSPNNQKIYLLLTGGSHTFKDPNTGATFAFLATPTPVSFVNLYSATISMYLYESTNKLSQPFSVQVVS